MKVTRVALLGWFLAAVPSAALVNPPGNSSTEPERRICRSVQSDSSTRLRSQRICRTASEWRDVARQDENGRDQETRERDGSGAPRR